MLVLLGAASVNSGATAGGAASDIARALGAALVVGGLPLVVPRYRSFRAFSWLFLIVTFLQLYLSKDRLIG
jgi:hypothetical protein